MNYLSQYTRIRAHFKLENEVSLDMSYFWYSYKRVGTILAWLNVDREQLGRSWCRAEIIKSGCVIDEKAKIVIHITRRINSIILIVCRNFNLDRFSFIKMDHNTRAWRGVIWITCVGLLLGKRECMSVDRRTKLVSHHKVMSQRCMIFMPHICIYEVKTIQDTNYGQIFATDRYCNRHFLASFNKTRVIL